MPIVPVDRYLARIGYTGDRTPGVAALAALQLAHLRAVPFENLDVFARRGVRVDLDWSLPKIVDRRRGGWCFELNGAFGALLDALGYTVTRHSAQVDGGDGLGPELDHLALVVHLEGRRWLVDVGFGDSSLAPLDLDDPAPQDGVVRRSRVLPCDDAPGAVELFDELPDGTFDRQYRLDPTPRELAAFAPRSEVLQTEPGLTWTQRRFATRPTAEGRVWLLTDRLKQRVGDGHAATTETPVAVDDWDAALVEHLGMVEGP